jgi:mono/diheme cytochrome c family protein
MSDQPYHRPLTASSFYALPPDLEPGQLVPPSRDGRASRPLERGVIHRSQYLESDPHVTGLTREEWGRAYALSVAPKVEFGQNPDQLQEANRKIAIGSPRYDPPGFTPEAGAKANPGTQTYVNEFPFAMTPKDMKRGQERYTIYCAVCHGPLGNGQGKIWERGYLTPTSFHTEMVSPDEVPVSNPPDVPLGYSRGYGLWGIKIPMRHVPVGYYFEVITKGYAGMPSYSAQIPPADRWRIIAYIKALQLSQRAPADLLDKAGVKVEAGGKK